jgi:uncharacterized protein
VDHVPPRKRPRWHEMLRDAWRARKGGPSAAEPATEEKLSSELSSSPAAETSSHAQGA